MLVGPSNVGKTHHTAAALAAWVRRHGPEGVVVLEFAPAVVRDGRLLGGRLDRFHEPSASAWRGTLAAHAPRADADDDAAALALARDNATRAATLLDAAPTDPRAVFVNDATIPFQSDRVAVDRLRDYCVDADCVVANAFESDELGTDDPVSTHERAALRALGTWADRVVRLPDERPPWER
ncbi:hypothetical protein RYH80_08085 [Halobaculum sp. MBLA0147]|uniref:hypothetical protein n=1 Tax=Halobaculum sp. MBLA0147 TaxID=3079934 RepID=UPI003526C045